MTRYRYVEFGRRATRWYETRDEADRAAEKAGMGSREDYPPHRFYAGIGVTLERRER